MTAEQPDGITDDSYDLPDPARAAERVNAFLAFYGDGLVEGQEDGEGQWPPLYARDLQALANLATTLPDSETQWGYRTPWGACVPHPSEASARTIVDGSYPHARVLVRREVTPWIEVQP